MPVRDRVALSRDFANAVTEAWVSLIVAADRAVQRAEAVCARHGITEGQYNVLRILRGVHPRGHPRSEITRRLLRRAPDVTRLLDRLERKGLVERSRSSGDRRLSVARITSAGLALLERIDPELEREMAQVMAPLSEAQLRTLARLCDALVP
jgi:DNA-binding MarR family transcriptional regulator